MPRSVKVVTDLPEGKDIARFPSVFRDPYPAPMPSGGTALLQVQIPDHYAQIFVDGELVLNQAKTTRAFLENNTKT